MSRSPALASTRTPQPRKWRISSRMRSRVDMVSLSWLRFRTWLTADGVSHHHRRDPSGIGLETARATATQSPGLLLITGRYKGRFASLSPVFRTYHPYQLIPARSQGRRVRPYHLVDGPFRQHQVGDVRPRVRCLDPSSREQDFRTRTDRSAHQQCRNRK